MTDPQADRFPGLTGAGAGRLAASDLRVVVVGAGLGGVAEAVGLNRSGHEVTLCERADRLRETGTAILIAPKQSA